MRSRKIKWMMEREISRLQREVEKWKLTATHLEMERRGLLPKNSDAQHELGYVLVCDDTSEEGTTLAP